MHTSPHSAFEAQNSPLSLNPEALTSSNWYISDPSRFSVPKVKQCKQKDYSSSFSDVFYKSPYRYKLSVTMKKSATSNRHSTEVNNPYSPLTDANSTLSGPKETDHVLMVQLLYDNLETVELGDSTPKGKNSSPNATKKSNAAATKTPSKEVLSGSVAVFRDLLMKDCKEAVFGSLAFHDVCSYKMGGRDFRLCLYVVSLPPNLTMEEFDKQMSFYDPRNSTPLAAGSQVVGKLVSPPFTIRAKKPTRKVKPVDKKRKATSDINPQPMKKMKSEEKISYITKEFSSFTDKEKLQLLSSLIPQCSGKTKQIMQAECFGKPSSASRTEHTAASRSAHSSASSHSANGGPGLMSSYPFHQGPMSSSMMMAVFQQQQQQQHPQQYPMLSSFPQQMQQQRQNFYVKQPEDRDDQELLSSCTSVDNSNDHATYSNAALQLPTDSSYLHLGDDSFLFNGHPML